MAVTTTGAGVAFAVTGAVVTAGVAAGVAAGVVDTGAAAFVVAAA